MALQCNTATNRMNREVTPSLLTHLTTLMVKEDRRFLFGDYGLPMIPHPGH
ncbi:hypothetical protein J6590_094452 [Homalodisca vitripennis]|nr:hypothetical protein J6590_094452 [Homalodisca vitripennis]